MSVAIRIELNTPSTTDHTVTIHLYIHDNSLACGPRAALAASTTVQIPKNQSAIEITLHPDMSVKHADNSWDEMIEPSMYIALDVESGSVTYVDGPVFQVQSGDVAVLKVKAR